MSSFGESPSEWVDDELRRVPLPEGLLRRLRALATLSDSKLDEALRDVQMPPRLLVKLRYIPHEDEIGIDDETLDRALRDVPVPAGLISELQLIAVERAKPMVEQRLRDIPLPTGFEERLQQAAMAACLADPADETAPQEDVASRVATSPAAAWRKRAGHPAAIVGMVAALSACLVLAFSLAFRSEPQGPNTVNAGGSTEGQLANTKGNPKGALPPEELDLSFWQNEPEQSVTEAVAISSEPPVRSDLIEIFGPMPAHPVETDVFGAPGSQLPEPKQVAAPKSKGQVPSWKDPELLLFQFSHGVHPFVALKPSMQPASDAALLTCNVPVVVSTAGYDAAWSLLKRPKLTPGERLAAISRLKQEARPEEFLAALDYGFTPPEPGTLGLRSAGGVAPFGQPNQRLLLVATVAGVQKDKSPLLAEHVRLSVSFNPKAVTRYRLVGHESNNVLGALPATAETTLKANQVAAGLFEVELLDTGEELVANVELKWTVPGKGTIQRQTMRISRWQLGDSLLETPPSVQAAAVAAETAELLRHSYYAAGRDHSWSRVRQVVSEMHPSLTDEPTFRRLMQLVRLAEKQAVR